MQPQRIALNTNSNNSQNQPFNVSRWTSRPFWYVCGVVLFFSLSLVPFFHSMFIFRPLFVSASVDHSWGRFSSRQGEGPLWLSESFIWKRFYSNGGGGTHWDGTTRRMYASMQSCALQSLNEKFIFFWGSCCCCCYWKFLYGARLVVCYLYVRKVF